MSMIKNSLTRSNLALIIILTLLYISPDAFAETQILDNIANNYAKSSINWFNPLFALAQKLFFSLAAIEIAWSGIIWALEKDEMSSYAIALVKKIMSIGFFYAILLNANSWMPTIIDSFIQAGQSASGVSNLSPSAILDVGLETTWAMLGKLHFTGVAETIATGGVAILASIIIIFSFAIIASQLLIALIESYIVISAGVLFLGFGGSRWTLEFMQKYISYSFAVGVKLFMLYLLIGIGQAQVISWPSELEPLNVSTVLSIMGSSLIYMFLVWQIPSMASSMLSGSPNMTAGSAASSIGASGAMMVGAGAAMGSMGMGAGSNIFNGAKSHLNSSYLETLANAASGFSGAANAATSTSPSANATSNLGAQNSFKPNIQSNNSNDKQQNNQKSGSMNESFRNLNNDQTQNIPQDNVPSSSIHIKLDHTGD